MSEKTINCPFCKEPILVDFSGDSTSYLCPACEKIFNVAKRTRRTRRTGVVVDGQSFSVKEQSHDSVDFKSQVKAANEDWKKDAKGPSFHDRVLTSPKQKRVRMPPPGYPPPPGYYWPPPQLPTEELGLEEVRDQQYEAAMAAHSVTEPAVEICVEEEEEAPAGKSVRETSYFLRELQSPAHPEKPEIEAPRANEDLEEEITFEEAGHVRRSKKRALTALLVGTGVVALFGVTLYFLDETEADPFKEIPKSLSSPILGSSGSSPGPESSGKLAIDLTKLEFESVRRPDVPLDVFSSAAFSLPRSAAARAESARKAALSFLTAGNPEERKKFSRMKPGTEVRMRNYYLTHPEGEINYVVLEKEGVEALDPRFIAFRVVLDDAMSRYLGLEATKDGYKVDWESFVFYSDMEWDEFQRAKPTKPLQFRVFLESADYYNNQFLDREKLNCYRALNYEPGKEAIYAYVGKDSDLDAKLADLLKQGEGRAAVVVTMRFPKNPLSNNQVYLDSLVSNGWMVRE